MDAPTLTSIKTNIQNITVCSELQDFKSQLLQLLEAELSTLVLKQTDLQSLTNPDPYIFCPAYVIIAVRELAAMVSMINQVKADQQTIMDLLNTKQSQLNC